MSSRQLTRLDLAQSGLRASELARIMDRNRSNVSGMMTKPDNASFVTTPPLLLAFLMVFPHAPDSVKKAIMDGKHLEGIAT